MIRTELVEYEHEDSILEGFVAWDDEFAGPLPVVLVAHMWGGRVEFCCDQAREMAQLGYVGFALDLYGKGVFGSSVEENERLMQPFLDDRDLLQRRMRAAVDTAKALPEVDEKQVAAIGFCFGGLCVLDLARVSDDVAGVISFHGLLHPPDNVRPKRIRPRIMVLHGHDDPLVSEDQVLGLQQELTRAGADWQFISFGHAMHAFTNPAAADPGMGTVYEAKADRRSRQYAVQFLHELFGEH